MKHITDLENMLAADKKRRQLLDEVANNARNVDVPIGQDEPELKHEWLRPVGLWLIVIILACAVANAI